MTVGIAPSNGFRLIDGDWARGVADGVNGTTQTLTANPGNVQATGKMISATALMVNIGAVATAGDSVLLNYAVAGRWLLIYNSSALSANVYARPTPNKSNNNALDTINGNVNTFNLPVAAKASVIVFCPANGIWAAK